MSTPTQGPTGAEPALRDPRNRVSRKAPLMWAAAGLFQALVGSGLLLGLLVPIGAPAWAYVVLALVALTYVVLMPVVRYRVHRWETSQIAVYTQTGWITRERRIAPMSRVQTVDYAQGVVSRVLGLASVRVTTASAAGPLHIRGLDQHVAESLVAELTRRTEAEPGDAT